MAQQTGKMGVLTLTSIYKPDTAVVLKLLAKLVSKASHGKGHHESLNKDSLADEKTTHGNETAGGMGSA
jgi:hypothetical protein